MSETLTHRIELAIDRWNRLPDHQARARLRGKVMEVSLQLSELEKLHRILKERVEDLEKCLSGEEAADALLS